MKKATDHILIIFGASGDLTRRKLIPSLFNLYLKKLLPDKFAVLGASRSPFFTCQPPHRSTKLSRSFWRSRDLASQTVFFVD